MSAVVLWAGVPFGWLWLGSQVQAESDSIGLALLAMAAGIAVSIAALLRLLSWLNLQHLSARTGFGLRGPR